MGFVLFLVSIVLVSILSLVSMVFTPIYYLITFKWKSGLNQLDKWFLCLAIGLDQFGNASCSKVLDLTMQKNGVKFGDVDTTVSYILGRNKYKGTLTWFGKFICFVLHVIDKDHVEKAVDVQISNDKKAKERVKQNDYKR